MKELLEVYKNTISEIFSKFGRADGYGELDIQTNVEWNMLSDSVIWVDKECAYSNDVIGKAGSFENYVLLYIDNGCGERFYQIFNNDLKNENLEN